MNPDTLAALTVSAGLAGLALWCVGLADSLYQAGMPRTRRSAAYDRRNTVTIAAGSACILAFVGGIARLAGVL